MHGALTRDLLKVAVMRLNPIGRFAASPRWFVGCVQWLMAWALWGAMTDRVHSQQMRGAGPRGNIPRYEPSSPTTSPYLNLLQPNGALPNYHALVRPLQRQAQFNRQFQTFARQQDLTNDQVEQRFLQPVTRPTGAAASFMNLGQGSGYQAYSHFYSPTPVRQRQRR